MSVNGHIHQGSYGWGYEIIYMYFYIWVPSHPHKENYLFGFRSIIAPLKPTSQALCIFWAYNPTKYLYCLLENTNASRDPMVISQVEQTNESPAIVPQSLIPDPSCTDQKYPNQSPSEGLYTNFLHFFPRVAGGGN